VLACAAGLASLISIPRPVQPSTLPVPRVDWREVEEAALTDEKLAEEAGLGLAYPTRVVGELVRRVGRAEHEADAELSKLRAELKQAARTAAQTVGGLELLELRSLQTELFAAAARNWSVSGEITDDLVDLGGAFRPYASQNGWLPDEQLLASDAELRAMFRIRWAQLTGLIDALAFRPRPEDWQLMLGFYLRYPPASGGSDLQHRTESQLGFVAQLERKDPAYPAALARGILLYRSGAYSAALKQLQGHLGRHPDGRWSLRARNFAAACAAKMLN
jgi:hypothetical protein